ncbi:hypothetical protein BJ165DRAFT_1418204 [Panaeolus papilionaceus]|nr:hypothetical protein BJ165DRAFT_1418204 [Panaeolus papilionaceus]
MSLFSRVTFRLERDLPDLSGKVVFVSGANAGIGYETVQNLARRGATVYLGSRSAENGQAAATRMKEGGIGNGKVIYTQCDLASPALAAKSAEEFEKLEKRLDILINNAACSHDESTPHNADGITDMMMINHIGTYQLTMSLLPLLKKTAELPDSDVRIVTLSSSGHAAGPAANPKLDFTTLDVFKESHSKDMLPFMSRYFVSKLANILFTSALQKRVPENIICIAVHPGIVKSNFAKNTKFFAIGQFLASIIGITADQGSYTSCFAAAAPVVRQNPDKYKGKYMIPYGVISQPSANARRTDLEEQLWETTENYLKGSSSK